MGILPRGCSTPWLPQRIVVDVLLVGSWPHPARASSNCQNGEFGWEYFPGAAVLLGCLNVLLLMCFWSGLGRIPHGRASRRHGKITINQRKPSTEVCTRVAVLSSHCRMGHRGAILQRSFSVSLKGNAGPSRNYIDVGPFFSRLKYSELGAFKRSFV